MLPRVCLCGGKRGKSNFPVGERTSLVKERPAREQLSLAVVGGLMAEMLPLEFSP